MEGPSGPYSFIDFGSPGEYNHTWSLLFRQMDFLDRCWRAKIYFSLIGDVCEDRFRRRDEKRYMALIVTNDSQNSFSRYSWTVFRDALQTHTYQQGDVVINFPDGLTDPYHLVGDYCKSGLMLVYSTSMNTYHEAVPEPMDYLDPGPIKRSENGRGYVVEFTIAGQRRHLIIVPSIIDTWR